MCVLVCVDSHVLILVSRPCVCVCVCMLFSPVALIRFWLTHTCHNLLFLLRQNFVEHVGDYIADICYLACRHKVKLEAAFINAALAVEIMEGIATALYPAIQVSSTALPMVLKAEMMHRLPFNFK